ncbi:hypothetical protein U9M48_041168 [Paspalum notatum var. saurae]|uniref:Vacuolar protein sorting-associated protein 13A n=1 Tax=Paspalum notatum var. saurae TaxID=547442 RepID=A0AAQ3UND7_PASNO
MFEWLVSQVLDGLLRRYVRSIQKQQLRIEIWKEELLLENVELILEAFDYLQLPFALKNGRIGKLSIRIPWKKLGWDPIIIIIEDVFWKSDSLDKRELAGKLAKLNAIELAKFSRRVTDNQTGQSFLSYISAKILDNIQVSMRNVHIVFMDTQASQGNFVFGLEFSSLSVQTDTQKQSFTMSLMGRSRQDEVNKIIEISDVGIYCHQLEEHQDLCHVDALGNGHSRDDYLVNPFCVTISVLANKAAKLDAAPQYDMTVELTALALSADEIQLQQILNLCDYFTICALRTKYGRYRPSQSSLSKRHKGWQRMWWQYAQNSVLADVHRRLKKTSWRYMEQRLNHLLRYVKLYRMKLELLQKGQIVSEDTLQELENMDKECDINDILNYRAIAEQQLQESLVKSTKDNSSPGSPRTDEQSAGASQGWLNWLSLGMLGAGGTADSSSFAGVISEDIIKDIYEGTEFHPVSSAENCLTKENYYSLFVINPLNEMEIFLAEKCRSSDGLGAPAITIQVDFPKSDQRSEASTRVVVQEFSAIYEPEFFVNVLHIYDLISSFQFQYDRVLSSLNRFDNLGARLVSKLKYMSTNHKKLIWDLRIYHFAIRLPSQNCERKELTMVVEAGDAFIQSKDIVDGVSPTQENNSFLDHISKSLPSYFSDDLLLGIQLDELYNHFVVGLTGFQVMVLLPDRQNVSSTLIKLDASIALRFCVISDEPVLRQLEVDFIVPFLDMHLSQTMYSAIVNLPRVKETNDIRNHMFDDAKTHGPKKSALNMSVSLKLAKLGLQVDLDGNYEESSGVIIDVEGIDIRYAICELSYLSLAMKMVNITSNYQKDESESHVLCLSGNLTRSPKNFVETCLNLHYRTHKHDDQIHHVYKLNLCDVDLHVNPSVIGKIRMFLRNLDSGASVGSDVESAMTGQNSMKSGAANGILPKFSLSNLCSADGTLFAGVSVDHFPFLNADYTYGYNFECLGTQDVEAQQSLYSKSEQCVDTSGSNGYLASDLASNSLCKTQHSKCSSTSSNNPKNVSRTVLDLSLVSVRVHFPESCGTLATLTIPESIATLTFFDASSWDLLLSANNLTLASPWTPPNIHELLWGTSSHHDASVLNVRVKKDSALSTEVCVGIQNVCCVLPSKLLSMFVGFFLLDDWNPIAEQKHPVAGNNLECLGESHDSIAYKFEICDCSVIFPVEEQDFFCLKLEVPHFFCEFIATGSSAEFAKRIPKEFFSLECIVSSRVDIICIYARNASISLLFVDDQTNFMLELDENIPKEIHSLIEKLDAGIWIQVPCNAISCSQEPTLATSIMSKISQCNLVAEDLYFTNGMEAVIGVIDQLVSIGKESKMYKGNALQFLEYRSFNEGNPDPNERTNITVSIKDLKILLGHSRDKGLALKRIATANMEFGISAVLVSEEPERMDFDVVSLALQSPSGYTLISVASDGMLSPVFIKFTKNHAGQDEISLSLPLFEVWLYLEEWSMIINHFHSYAKEKVNNLVVEHSSALSQFPETASSSVVASEFDSADDSSIMITCETIAGVVHIPIWEKEENHTSNFMGETPFSVQVSTQHETDDIQYHEPKGCKFVTVTFESKHFLVMSGDRFLNFKCDLERMKIMLEMIQENKCTSVPFVNISKVKTSGYIHGSERNLEHLSIDVQAEYMDVSFSHQIFSFWHNMELKFPATSSASSFYSVTFKAGLRKGSLLLNDGRWSSHGPVIETLLKNLTVQFSHMKDQTEVSAFVDLLINYNNIDKVMWEPFMEPSRFHLHMLRKFADCALDISPSTDVCLSSSKQLNLNVSEPLIEAILRLSQMITDSLDPSNGGDLREDPGILRLSHDDVRTRRYAPYILSNDTSLPFRFKVYRGAVNSDDIDSFSVIDENSVPAGHAVPIYVEETLDEFFFQHREARSSEHLIEKRMSTVSHYMISIEFDGTSGPSKPMSMDLVGICFFEVNFSTSKKPSHGEENLGAFSANRKGIDGLIVPVVLDVSLQNYSKRIRVYSTVILYNATSMPLELRFDIPFGVSSKVGTASIFFVDPSNDLGITIDIQDYKSLPIKFPRPESFSAADKSNGFKFSTTETITFYSNLSNSPLNVVVEKSTEARSGARELYLSVPFLLYNCTDLLLTVTESSHERNGSTLVIPPSFEMDGHTKHLLEKNGLSLVDPSIQRFTGKMAQFDLMDGYRFSEISRTSNSESVKKEFDKEVKAYMFAPDGHTPATELSVKLNASPSNNGTETTRRDWSNPFLLSTASGSTNVTIPQSSTPGAFLVAVASIPVSAELFGRTRAIAFRPRELLVSIRFDGPGWQWSGSFLPDHLGDAQLKMRNSASGVSYMVRVEVQNADLDINNKTFSGTNNINTGTVLILLSDDKTGFVPYRIDNFTMEKLRIYQQRCESIETLVYPYTSCQYAWDEPCYPHRLTVEIPGERSLGTFNLDILNDDVHVSLPSTSEKAERQFCISVRAEGAVKVLSVIDSNCHNTETEEKEFLGSKETKVADKKLELEMTFAEELLFASAKDMTIVAMQSLDQQRFTVEIQSMQIDNQFPDSPHPVMLSFEGSQKGKSMNFFKSKDTKLRSANDSLNTTEPVLQFTAAKWRTRDVSFISYQCINISVAPVRLELEERLVLSMIEFFRSASSRINLGHLEKSLELNILGGATDMLREYEKVSKHISDKPLVQDSGLLPSVVPVGAPWQQIHLLARKQKKVYIEMFQLTPVKLTFSFTSTPWLNRNEGSSDPSTGFNNTTAIQRGLMALLDVEGVPVYLGEIMVENLMASWQSVQDILVRHYSRQILHELYKVFGSAGVIGNPMGFARNVGFGLKDFISASRKGKLQSPVELLNGIAQGSKTLIGSTVYAVSSATSHFSKTAYKGLVALTYDEQAALKMEERERQLGLHGEGVLNGFLEGLTGLLQSPIRGAEKHGLPGVISGLAIGTAGLVARPMASILEATGRTAQSIRNRSNPHESNRLRVRFPRPVARDRPLFPYSWEEAIGISLLAQADSGRLKDEAFVMCKTLKEPGKFLVLTEKLLLLVSSPYLVDLGSPQFVGVPPDPQWLIDTEMHLKSIVHLDRSHEVVNIVGSNGDTSPRDKRVGLRNRVMNSAFVPLFHLSVELPNVDDAEGTLQVLQALIEKGKARRWDKNILHRSNIG